MSEGPNTAGGCALVLMVTHTPHPLQMPEFLPQLLAAVRLQKERGVGWREQRWSLVLTRPEVGRPGTGLLCAPGRRALT